jgi:hypothetical protein
VSDTSPSDDAVRRALRDLPEVAPPEGFYDALIRRRRRRARIIASAGLTAAALVGAAVVGQATGITGEVAPQLSDLVGLHQTVVEEGQASLIRLDADVPAPYQAPESLGPMERGAAMRNEDGIQVVYTGHGHVVSVFEQPGDLDEGEMPDDGHVVEHEGATWLVTVGAMHAVVVRRHDVVYVVIGDASPEELLALAEDLPDARPLGLARRIGDAMDDLVTAFGLG